MAVGEKHDSLDHHQVQAEMLALLADRVPATAVGLEMVSYEDQPILDAFSSGTMSESAFAAWWKKNWGFDYALYRPIFDEARRRRLPLYGLNAPAALVKAVAKNGLAGLSPADRARLPAQISESSDARYRAYVYKSVTSHAAAQPNTLKRLMIPWLPDGLRPDAVARMLMAMAVWNETMAGCRHRVENPSRRRPGPRFEARAREPARRRPQRRPPALPFRGRKHEHSRPPRAPARHRRRPARAGRLRPPHPPVLTV